MDRALSPVPASPARSDGERRILIVAGEPSGDLHGSRLVDALQERGPCDVRGIAGPRMRASGVQCLAPAEDLAVLGYSEVLARLPAFFAARRKLLDEYRRFAPHAVVLVDSPGFNLRLGPQLKQLGARVFYYIAPQVWAWKAHRARKMSRWVDRLAVVFPFEEPMFREAGVPATWVGHPLMDDLAPEVAEAEFRRELGVDDRTRLLGLLPGSRPQELHRHLGPMLSAADALRKTRPDLAPVVALGPGLEAPPQARSEGVRWVRDRTHATQAFSTACAVASGTATLETALFGTPHAIVYRTGRLNYAIARRRVRLQRIGLPNIVAGKDVAPELVQDALTPQALAALLAPWLDDEAARARQRAGLAEVRARLGGTGASTRAAQLLWELAA